MCFIGLTSSYINSRLQCGCYGSHMNFKLMFSLYHVCLLMIGSGWNSLFFPAVPWTSTGNLATLAVTFPVVSPPSLFSVDAFCQTLVDTLENTPGLRYIWSTLKPLLQGKVLYTPDTPAAHLLIREVREFLTARLVSIMWARSVKAASFAVLVHLNTLWAKDQSNYRYGLTCEKASSGKANKNNTAVWQEAWW